MILGIPRTPRQKLVFSLYERVNISAPSREDVRKVPCPYCKAGTNSCCIGRKGRIRKSNHVERIHAFLDYTDSCSYVDQSRVGIST